MRHRITERSLLEICKEHGEAMKRIRTLYVTICTIACASALTAACSSGDADPDGASASGSSSSGGEGGTSGSTTSTGSSMSGSGGSSAAPSVCDNNVNELMADQ